MGKKIKCSSTPRGRKSKDQGGGERNQRLCNYIHPWSNFTSVIFMSMGACVPIFRKIYKFSLPFAYYFCCNILLDSGNLHR